MCMFSVTRCSADRCSSGDGCDKRLSISVVNQFKLIMTKFILAIGGVDYQSYQKMSLFGKFCTLACGVCLLLLFTGMSLVVSLLVMVGMCDCL